MREVIMDVDRTYEEENDLIWTSAIKISDFLSVKKRGDPEREEILFSEDEDYTTFIMKVVNIAICITQENKEDSQERTLF